MSDTHLTAALRDRLETAAGRLLTAADAERSIHQRWRLYGKAEGIRLAQSYLDEEIRFSNG